MKTQIPNFSSWTMLLVDDDSDNLALIAHTLAYYKMQVYCAKSGEEALRLLDTIERPLKAILSDISMPGMDGSQLRREIRSRPNTNHIAIIAITAHAMKGDAERFTSAGFDGYISKPIPEPPILLRMLLTYVKQYADKIKEIEHV